MTIKQKIKILLSLNSPLFNITKRSYKFIFYRYSDYDKVQKKLRAIIRKTFKKRQPFIFIQIGSNDGKNGDPLFNLILQYHLQGILVEPVPYLFQRLVDNYNNQNQLIFENVAIGNPILKLKFYRLKETPDLPSWHNQLGSFKKEVIIKHENSIPNIEELIIEEDVTVISFEQLMNKHKLNYIDLLHLDCEGYDYEILKTIDFNKYRIQNILFENKHLSTEDYDECIKYLQLNSFHKFNKYGTDTLVNGFK